ncbi:MAG: hypothetical protein IIB62_08060 [Proteobacteria bacterium]|nr:hypothetical protein [Pseudomonadota bacterium]
MPMDLNNVVYYIIALVFVIALILIGARLLRGSKSGGNSKPGSFLRGRDRRLAVVEAASVDGRRKLILLRRDNVEHLIMTGGPVDLLIENGIHASRPANHAFETKTGDGGVTIAPDSEPAASDNDEHK